MFSGSVFACCYRILKENPEYRRCGKQACGLDDDRWIGIDKVQNLEAERKCYLKAASIYDKFKSDYINAIAKFDDRVREERRKMRNLKRDESEEVESNPSGDEMNHPVKVDFTGNDRDFSSILATKDQADDEEEEMRIANKITGTWLKILIYRGDDNTFMMWPRFDCSLISFLISIVNLNR